jgi:hypothetical protein
MEVKSHQRNHIQIAEIIADTIIIHGAEDGLDLLGNLYYQGFDKIILHEKHLTPDFFDLNTGIAGELLQKFSNYRMGLAIVGEFDKYRSKSLKDFMYESNKAGSIIFLESVLQALDRISER